jgi:molybdate transport system substrate-binding protein
MICRSMLAGMISRRVFTVLAAGVFFIGGARAQGPATPVVAAASDLQFVMNELSAKFRGESGREIRVVYGSSGNFYTQIMQGAPFQMFMSADEDLVLKLAEAGKAIDRGMPYAVGRIVVFAPHGSPLARDPTLEGLRTLQAKGELRRLAIANPEHAPYGRAAEQALRATGLWDAVVPRLVLGENVSQAAQFAVSGSAQGGVIAYSLVFAPQFQKAGVSALIPDSLHQPLRQRAALLQGAGDTAKAFFAFIAQPSAREIFRRYGFALPGG